MKKITLILALVFTIHSSFATESPAVGSFVISSFQKSFSKATEVQWQQTPAFTKAVFMLDYQSLIAYYTPDGELMAVTRNILSSQLPLNLLLDLKKNQNGMWISELFEVVNGTEHHYYVCLENRDEKIVLKAKAHKSWKKYKKIAKP